MQYRSLYHVNSDNLSTPLTQNGFCSPCCIFPVIYYRLTRAPDNSNSRFETASFYCTTYKICLIQWQRSLKCFEISLRFNYDQSRYGAGIEHLRQHFFRSSYPCQLVTRLRCVYRGARMLTGNTCAMHQVLKFLLAKWLFKVICYSFTL